MAAAGGTGHRRAAGIEARSNATREFFRVAFARSGEQGQK